MGRYDKQYECNPTHDLSSELRQGRLALDDDFAIPFYSHRSYLNLHERISWACRIVDDFVRPAPTRRGVGTGDRNGLHK